MSGDKNYPFISSRSPSYERAREEFLHPSPPGDADIVALLARLSEAEENASQTCSMAAEMITDEKLATEVREDAAAHQARRAALAELIEALGGSAPRPDECREILVNASHALARARTDLSAMEAMKVMREELSAVYGEAIRNPLLGDQQRAALCRLAPPAAVEPEP